MKKKVIVGNKNKVPKYFLGAALAGVQTVGSLASAIKVKNDAKAVAKQQEQNYLQNTLNEDRLESEEFEADGLSNVDYYKATGGKIGKKSYNTKGGDLIPLSSDTEMASGNTHGESKIDNTSGIKLLDNGKEFAEIEDKETIKDGTKVFSDRLSPFGKKTYAEESAMLAKAKGDAELKLKQGNSLQVATAKRQIAGIDKVEDALFQHQENSKENFNTKVLAGGGLAGAVPYIDNVVNTALTFMTPKTPKVHFQTPENLKTDINVNPQLAEVKNAVGASTDSIMNNSSNSNSARAQITNTRLAGMRATNDILGKKENIETDLKNRNAINRQQVQASNLAKLDGRAQMDAARTSNILGKISGNVANAVDDFTKGQEYNDKKQYQTEQLDVIKQGYNQGVTARVDLNNEATVQALMGDNSQLKAFYEKVKGTPDEAAFLKKFPNFKPF